MECASFTFVVVNKGNMLLEAKSGFLVKLMLLIIECGCDNGNDPLFVSGFVSCLPVLLFSFFPPSAPGCAPAAKKACKNCTCGRAEMEAAQEAAAGTGAAPAVKTKLTLEQISNPKSACGSVSTRELTERRMCRWCASLDLPVTSNRMLNAYRLGH